MLRLWKIMENAFFKRLLDHSKKWQAFGTVYTPTLRSKVEYTFSMRYIHSIPPKWRQLITKNEFLHNIIREIPLSWYAINNYMEELLPLFEFRIFFLWLDWSWKLLLLNWNVYQNLIHSTVMRRLMNNKASCLVGEI